MSKEALPSYSHVMADWLVELGYTHCFFVAGGGCMHLIEGFRSRFKMVPVVHEMSAGIAAEHFNECSVHEKAFALVTTGPGFTNIITAIAGCYVERRELLVIAGQVKTTDLITGRLRQRGVQEIDGTAITTPISVHSRCLKAPIGRADFRALVKAACTPHPGPVVIEVCLDVQGAKVSRTTLDATPQSADTHFEEMSLAIGDTAKKHAQDLATILASSKRPIILLGGLITRECAWRCLPILEQAGVPVMTTTSAMDRVPTSSPVWAGRPNSWGGQRFANMLAAQADVVIGIGVQWDLQQTGFNWQEYAPMAQLYQVYPQQEELEKGHPTLAGSICANPDEFLTFLANELHWEDHEDWRGYVQTVRKLVPVLEPANQACDGYLSTFTFLQQLAEATRPDDVLSIASSGVNFTASLQVSDIHKGQYATTSTAFASMGYGLATAIGCAMARPGKRIIHTEGDGGFSQNLQELAIIRSNNLNVKMFLFENGGYASIRATQRKFFGGAYVGCDEQTGLSFPDWTALFSAYRIPSRCLRPEEATSQQIAKLIEKDGPEAWIVPVDPELTNWPAVSSRILPDGKMQSNPLYQLIPHLPPEIFQQVSKYLPKPPISEE